MSDAYLGIKTLHILSAAILFGTGLGTAFYMWMAHRSGDVRVIAAVARLVVFADLLFTTPAVIMQPATGLALVDRAGIDPWAPWLVATYFLYALAGACWLPVVWLQMRASTLAQEALQSGDPLPESYRRIMLIWFALGWPAFLAVIAIFWLMVGKPLF